MAEDPHNKPVTGYPAAQPTYPAAQPSATAYPYPAQAPYYINYQTYPPQQRNTFFRRLLISAIALFIIIGGITFIIWLVLRPRLPDFSISSASVSPLNTSSSSQLTANWDLTFSVRNPNKKMNIYYDRIVASVVYGQDVLSVTTLQPFYQAKRNLTTVRARMVVDSFYVGDKVMRNIAAERSLGAVNFNFRLVAWVRFRSGAWRTRRHLMRVFCEDVKIAYSNATALGTLFGTGPRQCDVDL
ncbi:NDR1/HIN1-like protein 10 [Tasmannia lanceolata]|uniref:NDR1/HIN1-like protein 10 n=1 Tax=Tasmannia lanceolata TaxID=3420 RepID=UPI0040642EF1